MFFFSIPQIKLLKNTITNQRNILNNIPLFIQYAHGIDVELNDSLLLQYLEQKYGGYVTNVNPTIERIEFNSKIKPISHVGGDRFNDLSGHNYSDYYVKYLEKIKGNRITLLEIGILKGTGLAVWSEYFNKVDLYGFDWDLGNINNNLDYLFNLGAFKINKPKLYQYNQLTNNQQWLVENFNDIKFDVIIDDALHKDEAIINTFNELQPYLSDNFTYFIEDNTTAFKKLAVNYPNYNFDNSGQITVVTKK